MEANARRQASVREHHFIGGEFLVGNAMMNGLEPWGAALGILAVALACGEAEGELTPGAEAVAIDSAAGAAGEDELGQTSQPWWSYSWNESSCSDPTGTDSVLAALAVATARELRRWQPEDDFREYFGSLVLTSTGKARCADGKCMNTQALLDLQKDVARSVEVRPGVYVSPSTLRLRLTWNHDQQRDCLDSFFYNCRTPAHEFKFLGAEPGPCDMNYWFEVRKPDGSPLSSSLDALERALIWVDVEDNSYLKFQSDGVTIAIDPTLGLNEGSTTTAGSCSAACTRVSSANIAGQCCSCNGSKRYVRSSWSAVTYLCK